MSLEDGCTQPLQNMAVFRRRWFWVWPFPGVCATPCFFFFNISVATSMFSFCMPWSTLGPLCSLHRKRCEAPLNGSNDCIGACKLRSKITQKSQKCIFSKIVQELLASLKITQEHSLSTQDVAGTCFEAVRNFSFSTIFRPKMSRSGTSAKHSHHQTIEF